MSWLEAESITVDIPVFDGRSMSLKSRIASMIRFASEGGRERSRPTIIRALDDVSFRLVDGDRVGLIGRNGCGKTTLLRVLAGIYEPTDGQVRIMGQTMSLLDLTFGIDMEATGVENIYLRGYALGMTKQTISRAEAEICDFTELGVRLNHPVRTYSAGMLLRLSFSISLMSPHDIMLIDEVIGVGDPGFIGKTRAKLVDTLSQSGIVVIASHALDLLEGMCNKAIYLCEGRIIDFGPISDVVSAFRRDIAAAAI